MAGNKSQKSRDDKPKKRKREPNDADQKPKRPRKDQQDGKVLENGKEAKKNASNVQNGQKSESKALAHHTTSSLEHAEDTDGNGWKVSKPMGGRMLDIDPILTEDEQYVVICYSFWASIVLTLWAQKSDCYIQHLHPGILRHRLAAATAHSD